ncbi:MAG: RNA polymerase sigma factor [Actinobacteria bacterium]|nr:MAG: RNA polymerase sigma factor [Actinomycetota bacterium]
MEVSALKYRGGLGLHARSPILRLQSDERLIAFVRRGNVAAFEALVGRYETRLLAFCRHLLGSREDAEDILQEVMAAAFNAILADERPIKVRPWLYRIARNRCLNHLRRNQAMGVDSMDVHLSDNGASTADKVHDREEFRVLVGDIQDLPETQRTALVLREMDALSYEQIADAMETTVPSVKSLLVRARVSLAEAAEARLLSCEEVRLELGEVAEGLRRRPGTLVRRHLRSCDRCSTFRVQLRETNKALAVLLPFGPLVVLKKLVFTHLGHSAGTGAAGSGAGAAGSGAAAGTGTAAAGSAVATGAGGAVSAGIGAVATKAVAGLAVTAIVTASAVEVGSSGKHSAVRHNVASAGSGGVGMPLLVPAVPIHHAAVTHKTVTSKPQDVASTASKSTKQSTTADSKTANQPAKPAVPTGRTVVNNDTTNLAAGACGSPGATPTTTTPTPTTPTTATTTPTTGTTTTPTCPPPPATGLDSLGGGGDSTPTGGTPPGGATGSNPADGTGGTAPAGGGQPPAGSGSDGSGGSGGTVGSGGSGGSGGTPDTGGGGTPGNTGTAGTGTTSGGGAVGAAPPTSLK